MSNPLNIEQPPVTGGDSWKNAEHEGELIVLTVKGTGEHTFESGEAEFIIADITVIESAGKEGQPGDTFEDAWVLGRVLFGQLKRKIGRTFVGRIVKGQAQKGKSAPWQLDPVSADETARAVAFMNRQVVEQHTPEPAGPSGAAGEGPAPTEVGGDDVPPWARK
jgi:hypothetical protein